MLVILNGLVDFFNNIYNKTNNWMKDVFRFDELILGGYDSFLSKIPELFKWLGLLFVGFLLVLGVITFIRKFLKVFLFIVIILVVVIVLSKILL